MSETKAKIPVNEKTGEEYKVYNGIYYLPSVVAKMTPEAFAEQQKGTWAGHGNQAEQLAAFHAEATRVHKENTKPAAPAKEAGKDK